MKDFVRKLRCSCIRTSRDQVFACLAATNLRVGLASPVVVLR